MGTKTNKLTKSLIKSLFSRFFFGKYLGFLLIFVGYVYHSDMARILSGSLWSTHVSYSGELSMGLKYIIMLIGLDIVIMRNLKSLRK